MIYNKPKILTEMNKLDDTNTHSLRGLRKEINIVSSIMNSINSSLLLFNIEKKCVWANKQALLFTSQDLNSITGKDIGEILSCCHKKENGNCDHPTGCTLCTPEHSINNHCKETHITSTSNSPTISNEIHIRTNVILYGHDVFFLSIFKDDCSESKEKYLEHTFIHDLLNLSTASNEIILLLEEVSPSESKDLLRLLKLTSSYMQDALKGHKLLLDAEQGQIPIKYTKISPLEHIHDLLSQYRERFPAINFQLESSITDKVTISIIISLFERVLDNVLKNAVEAIQLEQNNITISMHTHNDYVYIEVRNKCKHISKKLLKNLFLSSYSTKGYGRGIGLYSVYLFMTKYLNGSCTIDYITQDEEFAINLIFPRLPHEGLLSTQYQ